MRPTAVAALAALALAAPGWALTAGHGPPEPAKNPLTHTLPHWVVPPSAPRQVDVGTSKVITGREALLNQWPATRVFSAREQPGAQDTRVRNPLTHRP